MSCKHFINELEAVRCILTAVNYNTGICLNSIYWIPPNKKLTVFSCFWCAPVK